MRLKITKDTLAILAKDPEIQEMIKKYPPEYHEYVLSKYAEAIMDSIFKVTKASDGTYYYEEID